jgi:ketosteroid isomerase-like protein
MRFSLSVAAAAMLALASPVRAAPVDDALSSLRTWLDRFNAGDMPAFFDGHAASATIVDEFAPYIWAGAKAPQGWAESFTADSKAHAITEPHMDYAAPIRAESDGKSAYIVLPTVYRCKQNGRSMSAAGTMTFVMAHQGADWKIASWTDSAPAVAQDR